MLSVAESAIVAGSAIFISCAPCRQNCVRDASLNVRERKKSLRSCLPHLFKYVIRVFYMNRFHLSFLLISAGLLGQLLAADTVYDNGASSRADGWEMTQWFEADDFSVRQPLRLTGMKFWNYEKQGLFTGVIVWEIYSKSSSGAPGSLLHTGTSSVENRAATGFALFGALSEFVNTFSISPLVLTPGDYWIALHNGSESNLTRGVFWAPTRDRIGAPSHNRQVPRGSPWFSNDYPGFQSDLAFQLHGVWGPQITEFTREDERPSFKFTTTAGQSYRVEYKNNLDDPSWTPLPGWEMVMGTGGEMKAFDRKPNPRKPLLRRFYRVVML